MTEQANRRPIPVRTSGWARHIAASLANTRITPNQISVASVVFAIIGAAAIVPEPVPCSLVFCALMIPLRLLCNMFDGMVAIECGKKSAVGTMYNEFPDRIADCVLIIALGYASGFPWLGWLGALLAAMTAYVRVFGGSVGLEQSFRGVMAKPHRMWVMVLGCISGAFEIASSGTRFSLVVAAVIIAAGSLITCITRTCAIAKGMKEAAQ